MNSKERHIIREDKRLLNETKIAGYPFVGIIGPWEDREIIVCAYTLARVKKHLDEQNTIKPRAYLLMINGKWRAVWKGK